MKSFLKNFLDGYRKSACSINTFPVSSYKSLFYILYDFLAQKRVMWKLSRMTSNDKLSELLEPPACVRGMKVLDRKLFDKEIELPVVILPSDKAAFAVKILKPFFLKLQNFHPVKEDQGNKLFYLNPILMKDNLKAIKESIEKESTACITLKKTLLSYDNWGYDSIFKAVLPQDVPNGISGFSIIGHIIHLNLKEHFEDYKYLIGQVFVDKRTYTKTVVSKMNNIDNTFRNFNMEILAGEDDLNVSVKENGFKYEFDFSEVFWNPRLSTEHMRIINSLESGEVFFDVFAGVGPFAIPAAKKECDVYANDLNPHSFKWLCHNAKLNKVNSHLQAFNLDGREFLCSIVKSKLKELWLKGKTNTAVKIVMNLPSLSFTFLDAFKHMFFDFEYDIPEEIAIPIVHCYFFLKKDGLIEDSVKEIESILECKMNDNILEKVSVRAVSSSKNMMRISFKLPKEILFRERDHVEEPLPKKLKLT